jgi:hypothetical protein
LLRIRGWAIEKEPTSLAPVPLASLANPSDRAVDLVRDERPAARLPGYEVQWREEGEAEWQRQLASSNRFVSIGLTMGTAPRLDTCL